MFREHGCELPCKRHVRAHECAISISHPLHVLSSELRKPIEKSVCLAILFAPSLILRVGGKQLDIAALTREAGKLEDLSILRTNRTDDLEPHWQDDIDWLCTVEFLPQ